MPINYARKLTGKDRSAHANRQLGVALAFIAGAINAGGYLAVKQYTSHMTGVVSAMADHIALGSKTLLAAGIGALIAFMAGAACSSLMVNYSRRRKMHSQFAFPLLLEALLLIGFGLFGARLSLQGGLSVPLTVLLLCFIMGLQNATITKLSNAEIRTTHVTGLVTDIGIELGKLAYRNGRDMAAPKVLANRARLALLCTLLLAFFVGGIAGAVGFNYAGYLATIPLALLLVTLAIVPALDDLRALLRRV